MYFYIYIRTSVSNITYNVLNLMIYFWNFLRLNFISDPKTLTILVKIPIINNL
jgi:hypothetical protein